MSTLRQRILPCTWSAAKQLSSGHSIAVCNWYPATDLQPLVCLGYQVVPQSATTRFLEFPVIEFVFRFRVPASELAGPILAYILRSSRISMHFYAVRLRIRGRRRPEPVVFKWQQEETWDSHYRIEIIGAWRGTRTLSRRPSRPNNTQNHRKQLTSLTSGWTSLNPCCAAWCHGGRKIGEYDCSGQPESLPVNAHDKWDSHIECARRNTQQSTS